VKILWEEVETSSQQIAEAAQAMVDRINAAKGSGDTVNTSQIAGAQVIDLRNNPDLKAQFAPLLKMAEELTGRDLSGNLDLGSLTPPSPPPAGGGDGSGISPALTPTPASTDAATTPPLPQSAPPGDDAVAQLERLSALKPRAA
jgi:hypothetical protein